MTKNGEAFWKALIYKKNDKKWEDRLLYLPNYFRFEEKQKQISMLNSNSEGVYFKWEFKNSPFSAKNMLCQMYIWNKTWFVKIEDYLAIASAKWKSLENFKQHDNFYASDKNFLKSGLIWVGLS